MVAAIERVTCAKLYRRSGFVLLVILINGLVGEKIKMPTMHITMQCIASSGASELARDW